MKSFIIAALMVMPACKMLKLNSGTYRVESARHLKGKSIVRLEGMQKEFLFDTDTLKKGDLVYFADRPKEIVEIGH